MFKGKVFQTIKKFGKLCAVESVVAFTFLVTVALCVHEGEFIAALVAFGVAAGVVVLGVVRFKIIKENEARKTETLPTSEQVATLDTKPKRNRAKPAPVKPRPKRVKAKPKK